MSDIALSAKAERSLIVISCLRSIICNRQMMDSNQQYCLCWSSNIIHLLMHKSRRQGVGYEGEARKHDSPHYGTGGLVCWGERAARWEGDFIFITPCSTSVSSRRTICTVT